MDIKGDSMMNDDPNSIEYWSDFFKRRAEDGAVLHITKSERQFLSESLQKRPSEAVESEYAAMADAIELASQNRTDDGKQIDFVEISGEPLLQLISMLRVAAMRQSEPSGEHGGTNGTQTAS